MDTVDVLLGCFHGDAKVMSDPGPCAFTKVRQQWTVSDAEVI